MTHTQRDVLDLFLQKHCRMSTHTCTQTHTHTHVRACAHTHTSNTKRALGTTAQPIRSPSREDKEANTILKLALTYSVGIH